MLLDGSACTCEAATACRANGIFRENLRQRVRELIVKCRYVGAVPPRRHKLVVVELRCARLCPPLRPVTNYGSNSSL